MNADLGAWVLPRCTPADQNEEAGKRFQSLKTLAKALKIEDCDNLLSRHHDALADAEMAFLIYAAVLDYEAVANSPQ